MVYMMFTVQCKAGPTLSGSFSIRRDLNLVVASVCCQAGRILSGGHCKLSGFINLVVATNSTKYVRDIESWYRLVFKL